MRRRLLSRVLLLLVGMLGAALVAEVSARIAMSTSTDSIRWYDAATQLKIEHLDGIDPDVVFVGTSMAAQAFDASRFGEAAGVSAYNAALVGGTPEVMDRWVIEEVVPRADPTTIVWGLSALDLAPAYGTSNGEIYDDALATRTGFLASIDHAIAPYSVLISERVVLRDPAELWGKGEAVRSRDHETARRQTAADGQRTVWLDDVTQERARVMSSRLAGFAPDPSDIDTIIETVRALQRDGIEVVMVELPVPERFIELYPAASPGHDAVGATLSRIADLTGTRLVRLVDGFTDDDFVDFTHLDRKGARTLTDQFAEAWQSGRDDRSDAVLDGSSTVAPEDCETETVIDEYGFEIELCIVDEPGDPGAGPDTDPDTDPDHPEITSADVVAEIVRRVLHDCDGRRPDDALSDDALSDAALVENADLESVVDAIEHGRECGTPASAESLERMVAALASFASSSRGDAVPDALAPSSGVPVVERLAASLDAFARSFEVPGFHSVFWMRSDELVTSAILREAAHRGEPIEVLAVGNSQTAWDLDQQEFDAYFGGGFLNVGHPGFDAEEWQLLWPRLPSTDDLTTVIWSTSTHRLIGDAGFTKCLSVPSGFEETQANRASLAELVGGDEVTAATLVGDDGAAAAYRGSTLWADWERRFVGPGDRTVTSDEFEEISDRELRGRYVEPSFCEERVTRLETELTRLRDAGVEVVLVSLPLHPEVIALAPEDHAAAAVALADLAERVGLPFAVIGPLTDAETPDGVHANVVGRARVTAELIAFLEGAGVGI